ncbi:hypothetical protein GCM10027093_09320 [Paraburkholderia jirisanensis]
MSTFELIAYQPMQTLETDADGKQRFRSNAIIQWMLATKRLSLTEMAHGDFPVEDKIQIAQLAGCTVSAYLGLPYVPEENRDEVRHVAKTVRDFEASLGAPDPDDNDD